MKAYNKQAINFKKGLVTLGLFLFFCTSSNAQDILTYKNGDEIEVKVIEINDNEIKFKKTGNLEGPTRVALKSEIFSVKYENGTKDVFNVEPIKTINNNTGPLYQNNSGPVKQVIIQEPEPIKNQFDKDSSDFANPRRKRFGGPRIGLTYLGSGIASDFISNDGKQPLITQFGWQFEGRLFTTDNGTQGLIEFVPLIGGIEQGLFIPSASVLLGLRTDGKHIFEFGIGPNFSVTKDYKSNTVGSFGVVVAVGTSFKSGNIYFPVTLAFVPGIGSVVKGDFYNKDLDRTFHDKDKISTGFKLSLLVGFNYRKK
ncbi:MAG: hypothetical protein Q8T03_07660 [Bacteroidota bacterium]|nr:hypothetical protein [Bacteroidota bacterium]